MRRTGQRVAPAAPARGCLPAPRGPQRPRPCSNTAGRLPAQRPPPGPDLGVPPAAHARQIVKLIKTRSAGDLAISWALLYITGLGLTVGRRTPG
jgi:hypothetical protein